MTFEERFGPLRPRVRELRKQELSFAAIGRALGCSTTTAWRLADDGNQRSYLESTARSIEKRLGAAA